jgi:hypothetical protein
MVRPLWCVLGVVHSREIYTSGVGPRSKPSQVHLAAVDNSEPDISTRKGPPAVARHATRATHLGPMGACHTPPASPCLIRGPRWKRRRRRSYPTPPRRPRTAPSPPLIERAPRPAQPNEPRARSARRDELRARSAPRDEPPRSARQDATRVRPGRWDKPRVRSARRDETRAGSAQWDERRVRSVSPDERRARPAAPDERRVRSVGQGVGVALQAPTRSA